jgi:hypothetical protein
MRDIKADREKFESDLKWLENELHKKGRGA